MGFGMLIATIIFVAINAYPIWRFSTFIENAIADPLPQSFSSSGAYSLSSSSHISSSAVSSSSHMSSSAVSSSHMSSSAAASSHLSSSVHSSHEGGALLEEPLTNSEGAEVIPDQFTLTGLWIGIVWAFICLASIGLPHLVSFKFPILQYCCRWMSRIAYHILTTFLWINPLLLIWEIINAVNPRAHGGPEYGNGALISAIVILVIALLIAIVHLVHALSLYTRHITFHSPKIRNPLTICHISDVHIGSRTSGWLSRVAKKINSEPCDLVVVSGDLFDYPGVQNHEMDPIFTIKAPVYAVAGNHDLATGDASFRRLYAYMSAKVELLPCTAIRVPGNSGVMILGVEDDDTQEEFLGNVRKIVKAIEEEPSNADCYRVLVNHRPWGFPEMAREELADLLLTGHTHAGGQLLAFIPLVKAFFPLYHGLYTIGNRHMFCSPGTGTWGPYVREWGLNLVTYIHLNPSSSEESPEPSSPSADLVAPICSPSND